MQKLISKYGLAAHLAIVAVAPLFLSPIFVFWLTALAAIWVLMEPSRIGSESLHEARRRVFSAIISDPFFWVALVVVIYTVVRFINGGINMVYDAETSAWSISKPSLQFMPGVVDGFGAAEFAAAVGMLVVLQGCRHALGRSARIAFALLSSSLCGLVATVFSVQVSMGADYAQTLLRCEYFTPAYIGTAMAAYFTIGTMALLGIYERKWFRAIPLVLLAIGGNAAGAFLFAPPYVHVVIGASGALVLLYAFFYARRRLTGSGEFKFLVSFSISVTLGGVLVVAVLSESVLNSRLAAYANGTFFPDGFQAIRDALSSISLKSWKECPWLGTGLGSFPFDMRFHAVEADWAVVMPEQVTPLNGYWHLLVERGIIGVVMIVCPLGFLLWTWVTKLIRGFGRAWPHPVCFLGPLLLIAVLVEGLVDISLLLPGVMMVVSSSLALSACSFPKERFNG